MPTRLIVTVVVAVLAPLWLSAQNAGPGAAGGRLLALSKGDRTISVIDPATLKILGKVPSGDDPHEVAHLVEYVTDHDGSIAHLATEQPSTGGLIAELEIRVEDVEAGVQLTAAIAAMDGLRLLESRAVGD